MMPISVRLMCLFTSALSDCSKLVKLVFLEIVQNLLVISFFMPAECEYKGADSETPANHFTE